MARDARAPQESAVAPTGNLARRSPSGEAVPQPAPQRDALAEPPAALVTEAQLALGEAAATLLAVGREVEAWPTLRTGSASGHVLARDLRRAAGATFRAAAAALDAAERLDGRRGLAAGAGEVARG